MLKEIRYISTRGKAPSVTASQAILSGLAPDGGLYVPESFPTLDISLAQLAKNSYRETAYDVLKLFLTDYSEEELKNAIASAYDDKFDTEEPVIMREASLGTYLELFHGPTIAFKDMALTILPHLMMTAAKKNGQSEEIVILTATSGDTGKAALSGFADVPGTRIIVFYPRDGVSNIQKLQMVTQAGSNTLVAGLLGNFDDAQRGVKTMFSDPVLNQELAEAGFRFSSANSINIGRLCPQVAYYAYAYGRMMAEGRIKEGQEIVFTVPTGNFGNILAAWYAKKIGIPVRTLVCASNENKVLVDFFKTGSYDRNRDFILTTSPSMDILISSNLERLIYELCGNDPVKNAEYMAQLSQTGTYQISEEMRQALAPFYSGYAPEDLVAEEIRRVFEEDHYALDPHTAVGSAVYRRYREETGDDTPAVIVSTASPYKFTKSVLSAILPDLDEQDDFALADKLAEITGIAVPKAISSLKGAPIRHKTECTEAEMPGVVKSFLS